MFNDPEREKTALLTEEGQLREETRRAHTARQFMENQLVKDAFAAVRDEAMREFKDAKPGDTHSLEHAKIKLAVVDQVATELLIHMQTGQLAQTRLNEVMAKIGDIRKKASRFGRMRDPDVAA